MLLLNLMWCYKACLLGAVEATRERKGSLQHFAVRAALLECRLTESRLERTPVGRVCLEAGGEKRVIATTIFSPCYPDLSLPDERAPAPCNRAHFGLHDAGTVLLTFVIMSFVPN